MSISEIVFIIYILISEYIIIKAALETESKGTTVDILFLLLMIILAPIIFFLAVMYIILEPILNRTIWKAKLMKQKEEIVSVELPKALEKYRNYFKN